MLDPLVSVLVCSLGWGISPIFAKKSMENMSHMISTAFYGLFFGLISIIILATLYLRNPNTFTKDVSNYPRGLGYAFLGAFAAYILGSLFFFLALKQSKNTALIILIGYVLPIIVGLILAKIIFNDKINGMMYLGMLITLIGLTITIKYKKD